MNHHDTPPESERKTFSQEEIESKSFYHQFKTHSGTQSTKGHLGMVKQMDDGFCMMAEFGPKGIHLPFITAWSGCIFPENDLDDHDKDAMVQIRKISDVVATEHAADATTRKGKKQ